MPSVKKKKGPAPLVPHIEASGYLEDVVIVRVPADTPYAERKKATDWAYNMAKKISRSREKLWWQKQEDAWL